MTRRRRIGIVFDNLGPYHVSRLAGAAARLDVVAIETSPMRSEYAWDRPALPPGVDYVAFDGSGMSRGDRRRFATEVDRLMADGLDAIALPGWSSFAALALLKRAARARLPVIAMSETNGWDFQRRPVTEAVKRGVVAHFAAGLATSDSQADYLVSLGMPATAVFRGYNTVDNAYFATEAAHRAGLPLPVVEGVALPEEARGRYFLTSNRFIDKKNLPRLLNAYAAFRRSRGDDPADWPLILVGDGEQRAALEALRATLGLQAHVRFAGFRQIGELPDFYATAGAFVHASTTEQWGLVVNEAMASGLPVAVSARCGCAEVLVDHGDTGLVFDPADEAAIAGALTTLAEGSAIDRRRMADAGRARIADWGPERFGDGMARAVEHALTLSPPRPGMLARVALALATAQRIGEARRNGAAAFVRPVPASPSVADTRS